jgi:hypothetical protein
MTLCLGTIHVAHVSVSKLLKYRIFAAMFKEAIKDVWITGSRSMEGIKGQWLWPTL